jgi:hypothetical protein
MLEIRSHDAAVILPAVPVLVVMVGALQVTSVEMSGVGVAQVVDGNVAGRVAVVGTVGGETVVQVLVETVSGQRS